MIIARFLAVAGKSMLPSNLRQAIDLPVRHQHLVAVATPPTHVIGVADFVFLQRLPLRQWLVFAARADERGCHRGVAWHEQTERGFGTLRRFLHRKTLALIGGINLQRHENGLQVLLAGQLLFELIAAGAVAVIQHKHREDQRHRDQQLQQGKGVTRRGGARRDRPLLSKAGPLGDRNHVTVSLAKAGRRGNRITICRRLGNFREIGG